MTTTKWQSDAKQKWDDRATFWHAKSKEMWDNGSRKSIVPFFKKHVPKQAKVLDLGCGDGYGSYRLWKEDYDVTGVDLSEEMVKLCQQHVTDDMNHLQFLQADMLSLPFQNESFNALMAINAIEWTEVPNKALHELLRVVEPGGYLCVAILGPTAAPRINSYDRLYGKDVIMNTMMPWEFKQLGEEQGLSLIDTHYVYKQGVSMQHVGSLSDELKQSLTFMTLFMFKK
ncbi:class I SAM-dependent methyltransferase [Filobacillus milosensis]|uniref:Class I SAM-dependent methyltransferase n=1 Tax=Filobacillus milosensis TaxID=94137 RepID=A0A4Y8ISH7_9BACI|nr:class I SAM-dependent methyltransferase [Filobacillus milosensis]TFB21727.1 class I SAM-dependent methyltransferase [Filobacillus milosensis]